MNFKKTLVIAPAWGYSRLPPGAAWMLESAARHGVEVALLGRGRPWHNFFQSKVLDIWALTRNLKGYDYVVFLDATDCLFASGLEEMHQKFEAMQAADRDFVIAGECVNWPWPRRFTEYPHQREIFSGLNSGFYMATWLAYRRVMLYLSELSDDGYVEAGVSRGSRKSDDQSQFWRAWLGGAGIYVDHQCQLAQCLNLMDDRLIEWIGPRPLNRVTGSRPCLFHANGRCKVKMLPRLRPLLALQQQ